MPHEIFFRWLVTWVVRISHGSWSPSMCVCVCENHWTALLNICFRVTFGRFFGSSQRNTHFCPFGVALCSPKKKTRNVSLLPRLCQRRKKLRNKFTKLFRSYARSANTSSLQFATATTSETAIGKTRHYRCAHFVFATFFLYTPTIANPNTMRSDRTSPVPCFLQWLILLGFFSTILICTLSAMQHMRTDNRIGMAQRRERAFRCRCVEEPFFTSSTSAKVANSSRMAEEFPSSGYFCVTSQLECDEIADSALLLILPYFGSAHPNTRSHCRPRCTEKWTASGDKTKKRRGKSCP